MKKDINTKNFQKFLSHIKNQITVDTVESLRLNTRTITGHDGTFHQKEIVFILKGQK